MNRIINLFFFLITLIAKTTSAQNAPDTKPINFLDLQWKKVAVGMPDSWYGSGEAKSVAENVLLFQKEIGGWAKNKPYHHPVTEADKADIIKTKAEIGATFDNGGTITEMSFLARVYAKNKDERYRKAFDKALNYIFEAQYSNGGWPQFYPFRKGKSVTYASHITYNDDAMLNVMKFLRDIVNEKAVFAPMQISNELRSKAKLSFDKGVECILKTQIIVNGKPTVWCAQHDALTLVAANARAYELASFSGHESVGITLLLMDIENPSKEIINAVNGAVKWFENSKIEGIKLSKIINSEGNKDLIVVEDKAAPPLWARFYDLETGKPYFCDRDGIKRKTFAELGYNRRNGYSWYTSAPEKILKKYPDWARKWGAG